MLGNKAYISHLSYCSYECKVACGLFSPYLAFIHIPEKVDEAYIEPHVFEVLYALKPLKNLIITTQFSSSFRTRTFGQFSQLLKSQQEVKDVQQYLSKSLGKKKTQFSNSSFHV